ncbi:MAG: DeoR/GlpR family DNA-binding transcription regulator [Sphaerochaetaceae bacterium]|nr:DeoR/GlpR family DNA-binding transcription regulator [Spirochaetales bacterium]MDY5500054.1 DeoR/GlpR family DNA-binding transcription regulator [Sphaerochaetaceae bacterium]
MRKTETRRQGILDIINQLGEINFPQLRHYFPGLSDVTLRKDLMQLDKERQIIRIHGGAKSLPQVINYSQRSNLHQKEKALIGAKAAALIQPGNSIFIASGSTCVELARQVNVSPLFIVTDGLITASVCPLKEGNHVVLLGGEIDLSTKRIFGQSVLEQLDPLHFHTAFLGTPAFHPDFGFSYLTDMHAAIVEKIISRSEKVVMLMDSSKVNYACSPWTMPTKHINTIVSDGNLDPQLVQRLKQQGVEVL